MLKPTNATTVCYNCIVSFQCCNFNIYRSGLFGGDWLTSHGFLKTQKYTVAGLRNATILLYLQSQ